MSTECISSVRGWKNKLEMAATTIAGSYVKASEAIAADQPSFTSTLKTTVMNRKRKKPKWSQEEISRKRSLPVNNKQVRKYFFVLITQYV